MSVRLNFDLIGVERQTYLDAIKDADTPVEMKQRIMLCRALGFLSDQETEDWIAIAGLKEA